MDDGESLWLSTTRGICRISRSQLRDFDEGRRKTLEPSNFGIEDGLRSAQCSPSYPIGGGGYRTADGRLWFTTTRGLAVYNPGAQKQRSMPPIVHIAELAVDGRPVELAPNSRLGPNAGRIQIRYTAIHLAAPEEVRYSYHMEGLDRDWVRAGTRRAINYTSLGHGQYRFVVRAELSNGQGAEDVLCLHDPAAVLRNRLVPDVGGAAAGGFRVGRVPAACAADPLAFRAGARRAGAPGPGNPRHPGPGVRRHLFAARCGGHVHAGGGLARAAAISIWRAAWPGTA